MHAPEYRLTSRDTAIAFLDACTATPATDEALFAVGKVSTLLEYALQSGDANPLKAALLNCDQPTRFFDLFACAIHMLADSLEDEPPSSIDELVTRCAAIEQELDTSVPCTAPSTLLAVAM